MRRFVQILVGLLVLRLALMATMPVFEPSEARYAAISANMARSGDFIVPHFTHNFAYQSFDGKPPLVFQAGGLFVKALGTDAAWKLQLGVRLFPLLSALLVLGILFHAVKRFSDADTARLAVLVCASCTAFYAAAGISMTDMTLTCCVAGALLLYRCFAETPPAGGKAYGFGYAAGIAALLGAGMITKGPVAIVMFGLPVLLDAIVNRRWKALFNWRWLTVAPVFLLVAAPWFVLVERVNPGSVWYFFYNENFLRFVSHDYGDKYGAGREAFRGVSVLWALVATLPWSLVPVFEFLVSGFSFLVSRFKQSNNPTIKQFSFGLRVSGIQQSNNQTIKQFEFLSLLAIVGFWCLTSRVLLYYLFPVVPLFAAWLAQRGDRARLTRLAPWAAGISALVLTVGLVGGALFSEKMQGPRTAFSPKENHYAVEFYHGRKSDAELAPFRKAWEAYQETRRLRHLKRKEQKDAR